MSMLQFNVKDVREPQPVAAGEYTVRIIRAEVKPRSNGQGTMLALTFDLPGEGDAKLVNHWLMFPDTATDEASTNRVLRNLKAFGEAFDVDFEAGIEVDELLRKEGKAILSVETSEEYGEQNRVKRFLPA